MEQGDKMVDESIEKEHLDMVDEGMYLGDMLEELEKCKSPSPAKEREFEKTSVCFIRREAPRKT